MLATAAEGARGEFATQREKVRAFWKLNIVAYPEADPYNNFVMKDIIDSNESLFGEDIGSYDEEVAATQALWEEADYYLKRMGSDWAVEDGGLEELDTSPASSYGVHAVEWSRPGFGVVLCFRGSYSTGDFLNLGPWLGDWILKRMSATMQQQWTELAGLDDLEDDVRVAEEEGVSEQLLEIMEGHNVLFNETMAGIARDTAQVNAADVEKTGYWEFTKHIVDSVYSGLDPEMEGTLYITGHSQGGSRAALSSMYLEKKFGEKFETITFAAVGGACFSRNLTFTGGDMLEDVNPFASHEQVTDYVHPLDIYGHFDYDVGRRCSFGHTGIKTSRAAKYCRDAFLHTGPTLMLAVLNSTFDPQLATKFAQCRYFTHSTMDLSHELMLDDILYEDGSTDGGCVNLTAPPKYDADEICPSEVTLRVGLTQEPSRSFLARPAAAATVGRHSGRQ